MQQLGLKHRNMGIAGKHTDWEHINCLIACFVVFQQVNMHRSTFEEYNEPQDTEMFFFHRHPVWPAGLTAPFSIGPMVWRPPFWSCQCLWGLCRAMPGSAIWRFVSGPQESDGYTVMVNWEFICPKSWRYPGRSLDGLFHGESQSKIDDWGYPHWIAPNFFPMNH